jgi:chemotaxis protein MotB
MNPRAPRSRVSHERWLVSYADFITLMFGFFVVLYAFARADQRKQMQVSAAIDSAFRSMGAFSHAPSDATNVPASGANEAAGSRTEVMAEDVVEPQRVKEDLNLLRGELSMALASQVASHAISLEMGREGLVISLREAGFFDSGSATPKPEALPVLRQIAAKLGSAPYDLRIEGHTDNVPVHDAQFESNWELSGARATHIARILIETKAVPPERISAAGYGEYHPIASNDTPEGRAENRRVDLVVMPRTNIDYGAPDTQQPSGEWKRVTEGD